MDFNNFMVVFCYAFQLRPNQIGVALDGMKMEEEMQMDRLDQMALELDEEKLKAKQQETKDKIVCENVSSDWGNWWWEIFIKTIFDSHFLNFSNYFFRLTHFSIYGMIWISTNVGMRPNSVHFCAPSATFIWTRIWSMTERKWNWPSQMFSLFIFQFNFYLIFSFWIIWLGTRAATTIKNWTTFYSNLVIGEYCNVPKGIGIVWFASSACSPTNPNLFNSRQGTNFRPLMPYYNMLFRRKSTMQRLDLNLPKTLKFYE